MLFASSGAAAGGFERIAPYDAIAEGIYDQVPENYERITHDTTCPNGVYRATKVWGQALGRHYSDTYDMSVLCVRIGRVYEANRPESPGEFSRYLSHRDIAQFLQLCVEAPEDLAYDIFFATSNNRWGYRDIEHPRKVLGYEPQDSAEPFR